MSTSVWTLQGWEKAMDAVLADVRELTADVSELSDASKAPSGANAPYKIQKRGESFVVVNNTGEVKATFDSRDKALKYLRALYANVPGAGKRADKVKFSGKGKQRIPKKD